MSDSQRSTRCQFCDMEGRMCSARLSRSSLFAIPPSANPALPGKPQGVQFLVSPFLVAMVPPLRLLKAQIQFVEDVSSSHTYRVFKPIPSERSDDFSPVPFSHPISGAGESPGVFSLLKSTWQYNII